MLFQESNITVQQHILFMELAPRLWSKVKYLFQESANNRVTVCKKPLSRTYWANYVWNMGDCGPWCSTKIQYFRSWWHVNFIYSTKNGSRKFWAEWIPNSVFNLFTFCYTLKISHQREKKILLASLFTSSRERDTL